MHQHARRESQDLAGQREVLGPGFPERRQPLVDVALADYPQVWAAGGIPHAVFPTTFDELLRLTAGEPAQVA